MIFVSGRVLVSVADNVIDLLTPPLVYCGPLPVCNASKTKGTVKKKERKKEKGVMHICTISRRSHM